MTNVNHTSNGLLLFFMADVFRSSAMLAEFLQNPEAVLAKYDLTEDAKGALFSIEPETIATVVRDEVVANVRRAISPDYPVPEVGVTSISPEAVPAGTPTLINLLGEGLMSHSRVAFIDDATQSRHEFVARSGSGSFSKRMIEVSAILPPGRYRISVRNSSRGSEVISNLFVSAT